MSRPNDPCINGIQYEDTRNQTPGTVLTTSENAALSALCKLYFALNLLLQMLSSHVYVLINPYPADSNYCAFVVFAPNLHNFLFTHLCTSPQARFAEHNSCTFV